MNRKVSRKFRSSICRNILVTRTVESMVQKWCVKWGENFILTQHRSTFRESNARELNYFIILEISSSRCPYFPLNSQTRRITAAMRKIWWHRATTLFYQRQFLGRICFLEIIKKDNRSTSPSPRTEILPITINLHDLTFPSNLLSSYISQ
jgi:hypothetical protein